MASVAARCDHCRKVLRASRSIDGPGGTQFDSLVCRQAHTSKTELKRLQNGLRVARSRLKTAAIKRAAISYRNLGGRDWVLVEQVLRALL